MLSAQCIPVELKTVVINKLEILKDEIAAYPIMNMHPTILSVTKQQINDNINFLKGKDLSHLWPKTVDFNRRLDSNRNQGPFEKVIPEYAPYV